MKSDWIDIFERKPRRSGRYLVIVCAYTTLHAPHYKIKIARYNTKTFTWCNDYNGAVEGVRKWMALPKMPLGWEDA